MPYGNTAGWTRTYQFGTSKQPSEGRPDAIDEMRRRNDFWNALVALERATLAARAADLDVVTPGWNDLQGAERTALWRRPEVKVILDRHEARRKEQAHTLMYEAGLYWGNYNAVRLAYEQARTRPGELRFHAWARTGGTLTVQIQGGLTVADLFAGRSSQIQIDPVDLVALASPVRAVRRRAGQTTLRFRIRSTPDRRPVWLTLPLVVHRPLPAGGRVKAASVLRERIGEHERWSLVLSVEQSPPALRAGPAVGIDIGWRRTEHGLRVAVWRDAQGEGGELLLPARWLAAMDTVARIEGARATQYNAVRPALAAWLAQAFALPDWLREATETLALWRSPERLAAVVRRWRHERFHGDDAGFALAEAWRQRDKHLGEYAAPLRDQLIHSRRERYRVAAAQLVARWGVLKLERFDLRRLARAPTRAEDRRLGETDAELDARRTREAAVRAQRVLAAPSVLRSAFTTAARHAGIVVEEVDAALTTRVCPTCGYDNRDIDFGAAVVYQCRSCGTHHDQDGAAATMILRAPPRAPRA